MESCVLLHLQFAKIHAALMAATQFRKWGHSSPQGSIPPALLTTSTSTERAAHAAQVSKSYSSGPQGIDGSP